MMGRILLYMRKIISEDSLHPTIEVEYRRFKEDTTKCIIVSQMLNNILLTCDV